VRVHPRRIAVANHKGGTGKTTTVVNLAAALAESKQRVLVIDLDPQAAATQWLGAGDVNRGIAEMLTDGLQADDAVLQTVVSGIDLIGASEALSNAERYLSREVGAETVLRRKLERLPGRWDYLLFDCPPSLGLLTLNALVAADEVLMPVEAHVMALRGLVQLLGMIDLVRDRLNPGLSINGIVACRVDARTRHALEVVEQLQATFGQRVYRTVIRENVRLAEAPSFAKPIAQYEPRSSGAHDYRALADEVLAQHGTTEERDGTPKENDR
jgi:chromosome partitioning protein